MSISGTRSAYTAAEIADVAHRLARQPRPRPTTATALPPEQANDHTG
jgi:hypothetical protein